MWPWKKPKGRTVDQMLRDAAAESYDAYVVGRFVVTKDEFVTLLLADQINHKLGAYRLQYAPVPTFQGLVVEVEV